MKYNNIQKEFILYVKNYKSDIQGYLFKNIFQDFLKKNKNYGIDVEKDTIYILSNNSYSTKEKDVNQYLNEIFSLFYLIYELEKKELIFFSKNEINDNFKFSLTEFKNDTKTEVLIQEEKVNSFLKNLNSQIYLSTELKGNIYFNRFIWDREDILFKVGFIVSIATIVSTIHEVLSYYCK